MAAQERTERIALRLTPEESAVVNAIADESGLSVSDVVRQAIRRAYAERFEKKKKR